MLRNSYEMIRHIISNQVQAVVFGYIVWFTLSTHNFSKDFHKMFIRCSQDAAISEEPRANGCAACVKASQHKPYRMLQLKSPLIPSTYHTGKTRPKVSDEESAAASSEDST
jgi:hypothetical protein